MARNRDVPKTWAEAYTKVHLEDAARKREQKPWRPFREDYEVGEHQGRATVQRKGSRGAHIFATFDTKKQAQQFLKSCPSKKRQATIVVIDGMNYWKLPNGRKVGSWHGDVPPPGGIHLGKGWWLDMRSGEIYRQKRIGKPGFTYSEVDDYFNKAWNKTRSKEKALVAVERKYGSLQRDRIEQQEELVDEEEG